MKIKRLWKLISYGLSFVLCCQLYSSVAFAQTKPVVQELTQQEIQLAAYPDSYSLNVTRCIQQKSKWCWAATIQMLVRYNGIYLSQDNICLQTFGTIVDRECAVGSVAITIQNILHVGCSAIGTMSFDNVKSRIYNNRNPFGIRVAWNNGGGHFMVCNGYYSGSMTMVDPANVSPGTYSVLYASAVSNANFGISGTGQWTHSIIYG